MKRMSAKRRPYRSAIQPPGYWYTPSRKSSAVPNRPIAVIGAPSDCRYLGKKRRQRFSPHPIKNMLVDTATISGVSPKNSRARARRPGGDSVERRLGLLSQLYLRARMVAILAAAPASHRPVVLATHRLDAPSQVKHCSVPPTRPDGLRRPDPD